jgi:hypothetical protein
MKDWREWKDSKRFEAREDAFDVDEIHFNEIIKTQEAKKDGCKKKKASEESETIRWFVLNKGDDRL